MSDLPGMGHPNSLPGSPSRAVSAQREQLASRLRGLSPSCLVLLAPKGCRHGIAAPAPAPSRTTARRLLQQQCDTGAVGSTHQRQLHCTACPAKPSLPSPGALAACRCRLARHPTVSSHEQAATQLGGRPGGQAGMRDGTQPARQAAGRPTSSWVASLTASSKSWSVCLVPETQPVPAHSGGVGWGG